MFTESDTWNGGSIELLVALGNSNLDRQLRANRSVWQWPALQGPYAHRDVEPSDQSVVFDIAATASYYGVASLPDNLGRVAFSTCFVEDEDGLWLYAGSPLGSLSTVFPVGAFPFGEPSAEPWERTVYEWLFDLAQHLVAEVPFTRAVVGWLTTLEVEELAQSVIPEQRAHGYIIANDGILEYYAPNQKGALLT